MINNVTLMGRLVADPELRTTNTGKSVCNFRVAVDRAFSKDKQTDFITIVAWENTADFICKYFSKGSMIALRGEIQTRSYEDNSGNKRVAVEVLAKEVSFCGGKKESNGSNNVSGSAPAPDFEEIEDGEELPF
jgi:single-strand DNA-binding protein